MGYMEFERELEKKVKNQRRIYVIAASAILLAVAAAVTILLIATGIRQARYQSAMEAAYLSYREGDFETAVSRYKTAISIDEKKDKAYGNLASVYMKMGEFAEAENLLNKGLAYGESEFLRGLMTQLAQLQKAEEENVITLAAEELQQKSLDVTIDPTVLDMVAAYTYTEYFRDYGYPTETKKSGEQLQLFYQPGGFTAIYYNLENERVVDSTRNVPLAGAKPNKLQLESIRQIFSSKENELVISYAKLTELFGNELKFIYDEQQNRYYISTEYQECLIKIETDEHGNVLSEAVWNEIEPLSRDKVSFENAADGEVKGYVQNALTGKGMSAVIKVREKNKKAGQPLKEINSTKAGEWEYAGKAGKYTLEVSAKGYITEYFHVEIEKGNTITGKNFVLSPEVAEGEIRIVLTWGSTPTDLDSYAIGTSSSGKHFGISFTNKTEAGIGNLDVDDTSGHGPETITITDPGAEFLYSVVDFRAEGTMGGTGAKVKVYLPGENSPITYTVPSGEGIYWEVFRYKDGKVQAINTLDTEVGSTQYRISGGR